jgi:hypothetical protein
MRKALLPVFILIASSFIFAGCIKNTPYITSTNPTLSATIYPAPGYKFIASATVPSTIDSQAYDTTQTLIITGYSSDKQWPNDKIVLSIASYHGQPGTWSIVQGQGAAAYIHGGIVDPAAGGVISITKMTSNTLIGYFSFTTVGNIPVSNGEFTVNKP